MSKEIMQMALDALKTCGYDYDREESIYKTYDSYQIDLTIAALEAELAKPEQPQTDLRKAAEMALESLEDLDGLDTETECVTIYVTDEIEALRQALAQPEQTVLTCSMCGADRTKEDCKGERMKCGIMGEAQSEQNFCQRCGKRLGDGIHTCTPPEQEPVAYWNGQDLIRRAEEVSGVPNWTDCYYIPLYSEPQNKPLIALTDEEIETTFFDMQQYVKVDLKAFARAIEVKLREKNG